jgi:hypothetical protein
MSLELQKVCSLIGLPASKGFLLPYAQGQISGSGILQVHVFVERTAAQNPNKKLAVAPNASIRLQARVPLATTLYRARHGGVRGIACAHAYSDVVQHRTAGGHHCAEV